MNVYAKLKGCVACLSASGAKSSSAMTLTLLFHLRLLEKNQHALMTSLELQKTAKMATPLVKVPFLSSKWTTTRRSLIHLVFPRSHYLCRKRGAKILLPARLPVGTSSPAQSRFVAISEKITTFFALQSKCNLCLSKTVSM